MYQMRDDYFINLICLIHRPLAIRVRVRSGVRVRSELGCDQSYGSIRVRVRSELGCDQSQGTTELGSDQSQGTIRVRVRSELGYDQS